MRVAPIGLLYSHDLALLKKYAAEQSIITHNNPQAIAGSVAVAFSVAYMINNGPYILTYEFDKNAFLNELIDFIEGISDAMAVRLRKLKAELNYDEIGLSGWVLESVPAAIYAFVKGPDYFNRCLCELINSGGDSDTNGSIYGAISGSLNSIFRIPRDYIDGLENKYKGRDHILSLSKKLYLLNEQLRFKITVC